MPVWRCGLTAVQCETPCDLIFANSVQEQEPLIENLHQDTEGVMHRMQAATHRLQEVLKKMNFCTQLGVIIALMIVLIFMLWFTFS